MHFFKGSIEQRGDKTFAVLKWPDYKHTTLLEKEITNKDAFVSFFISEQQNIAKSVIKRYVAQRVKELRETDLLSTAKSLKTYCGDLKKVYGVGALCHWIESKKGMLLRILPQNNKWAEIIPELILYAENSQGYVAFNEATKVANEFSNNLINQQL